MNGNTFGKAFSITTFGESHGPAIGVVIDGCPPLLPIDLPFIQSEMQRRRPGQSHITTSRNEEDLVEILSGVFDGKSTGHPICLMIRNKDQRSKDYSALKDLYRPSHADFVHDKKYGIRDYRGGGRASARETAARVAAGAIAKLLLKQKGVDIKAFVSQAGSVKLAEAKIDYDEIENNLLRCPNADVAQRMIHEVEMAKTANDSIGGVITCHVNHCPIGLGNPVFDKLEADLAKGVMSIPATKAFEIGSGTLAAEMKGSEHNDLFINTSDSEVSTKTNFSGGVQGGISNGQQIVVKATFKPVATIGKAQKTVDNQGNTVEMEAKGRHDPCVVPRAVPIVEAMAALVIADHLLRFEAQKALMA